MADNNIQPVRLAYNSHEPVSGMDPSLAPLLFLHGLTGFKEYWADIPQIVADATKRKAYSIDSRNHGDSEWSDYFNFDVNVDDLIHFMDTIGISKAIIIGHSMGGITAAKTALKRPDRVEKIVVEDMFVRKLSKELVGNFLSCVPIVRMATESAPPGLDEEGILKHIVDYIMANIPPEMADFQKRLKMQNPEDMKRLFNLRRDADGKYHWKANMEVLERSLLNLDTLSQDPDGSFEGPACFIYGTVSPFAVIADEQHIRQFFPSAEFVGIEDASHSIHTEKPVEFTDALLKFIS